MESPEILWSIGEEDRMKNEGQQQHEGEIAGIGMQQQGERQQKNAKKDEEDEEAKRQQRRRRNTTTTTTVQSIVEQCQDKPPKIPLGFVLVLATVVIIIVIVSIALVPVSVLWSQSLIALGNAAENTAGMQLKLYRHLVVEKAVRNVTEKLQQSVYLLRQLSQQIPSFILDGNCTTPETWKWVHAIMPAEDSLFADLTSLNIVWHNEYGDHLFCTRWRPEGTYGVYDSSERNSSLIFYKYDSKVNPTTEVASVNTNYNIFERPWWIAGVDPTKLVNLMHWNTAYQSPLKRDGAVVGFTRLLPTSTSSSAIGLTLVTTSVRLLTAFFATLNLTEHGRAFLIDGSFNIVTTTPQYTAVNETTQRAFTIFNSPDKDVVGSSRLWLQHSGGVGAAFQFEYNSNSSNNNSEVFYVDVAVVRVEGGLEWWLFLLTPPRDFFQDFVEATKKVEQDSQKSLGIVFGIEAAAMIFMLVLSISLAASLAKSLTKVTARLQAITDMDFSSHSPRNSMHRSSSSIREISQLEEKARQMGTALQSFGKYVPTLVVQYLIRHNLEATFGIGKTHACIWFLDVVNFTSNMQIHGVEVIINVLHELFEEFSSILVENGAVIDKYIGDSIMALFGVPERAAESERNACKATQEVMDALAKQNEGFERRFGFRVGVRIGFHSGPVYAGNVGSSSRLNYTVMGDTVNLAARLEPLNKELGTSVCVSDSIREKAGDDFIFRCLGRANVRGFSQPQRVHEFLGKWTRLTPEMLSMYRNYVEIDKLFMTREQQSITTTTTTKKKEGDEGVCVGVPLAEMKEYVSLHPEDIAIRRVVEKLSRSDGNILGI